MTTQGFVASHARDAEFERGLRSFYEYRDLGIKWGATLILSGRTTSMMAGGEESKAA